MGGALVAGVLSTNLFYTRLNQKTRRSEFNDGRRDHPLLAEGGRGQAPPTERSAAVSSITLVNDQLWHL